jgi:hypothetical protein
MLIACSLKCLSRSRTGLPWPILSGRRAVGLGVPFGTGRVNTLVEWILT